MNDVFVPWNFDRAAALDRLDHDTDLLDIVIRQFLEDAPATLSAIETAIVRGDGPALRDAAHSLKGAAGYLAADNLCLMAQTLEGFGRGGQLDEARATWPAFSAAAHGVVDALRRAASGR